jgi:hypothetical protein
MAEITTSLLNVPDRFEALRESASASLGTIIVPVEAALAVIDECFHDMRAAHRGALLIMKGTAGAGKSTFLDTIRLFRPEVTVAHVPADEDIPSALRNLEAMATRLLVLDGREAVGQVGRAILEEAMHAINGFVRSERGRETLVVWPTNSQNLTEIMVDIARTIGAEALFGVGDEYMEFTGPPKSEFVSVAARTIAALNEGASLASMGISEARAVQLLDEATTIGHYMALVRKESRNKGAYVQKLLKSEPYHLWTLVIADDEPEGDVAALTRGGFGIADIDRLMTATAANVVVELQASPERVGLLAAMLDARIIYMDLVTICSVIRQYGDVRLHGILRGFGVQIKPDRKAAMRLQASDLGVIISGGSLGVRKPGRRAGTETRAFYSRLSNLARTNDGLLNGALGHALVDAALITDFVAEKDLGTVHKVVTDLFCLRQSGDIRLEVMWRLNTGRAEIANYVLKKLGIYGRAAGII